MTQCPHRAIADIMTETDKSQDTQMNFEDALKSLEAIVHQLESGEAPLDESIALYERGNALRAMCQQRLDAAKTRIEAITMNADGSASSTKAFDAE